MKKPAKMLDDKHVVVESVDPVVDGGRFPAKAVAGAPVTVAADVYSHGHEAVRAYVRYRPSGTRFWTTVAMSAAGNDRFSVTLTVDEPCLVELEILGEVDALGNWRRDAARRVAAGRLDVDDASTGSRLLEEAAELLKSSATSVETTRIGKLSERAGKATTPAKLDKVLVACDALDHVLRTLPPTGAGSVSPRFELLVSRAIAGFSSWYECFPRSTSPQPGRPGTLTDLAGRLDYVASLGFDVLYLPPIHPIGVTARKGRDNTATARRSDVGSPWAIGSAAGGHTTVAPELGTIADFDALVAAARDHEMEIALDLAFQCSPDHPWVVEHPAWFVHRSDGSIACAENPPKRYEDIFPLDFDTPERAALYEALLDIVLYWISHGVRIFRVDNPHTKPFAFWEWLLSSVRRHDPGVVFLSEAFTRPKVMHRLAKLGFDQSYTYFTWRNTKHELTEYFLELAHGPGRSYFRPNVWPNTPDILATSLQTGGRASFVARLVLAAGLSSNYGIYGPLFELLVDVPALPGSDGDYRGSEKFEVRRWDLDDPKSIAGVISTVNQARHTHRALQSDRSLAFHAVDNDQLLCWSKIDASTEDRVLCIVNLDPRWAQSGFVELDLGALRLPSGGALALIDHLDGARYTWSAGRNFVLLDPARSPAHLFSVAPARSAAARTRKAPESSAQKGART